MVSNDQEKIKEIVKEYNKGEDYNYLSFKYKLSPNEILNIIERNKHKKW